MWYLCIKLKVRICNKFIHNATRLENSCLDMVKDETAKNWTILKNKAILEIWVGFSNFRNLAISEIQVILANVCFIVNH